MAIVLIAESVEPFACITVLPESERPKEATNLEDAFQLLAEHAVELNITLHNPSARRSAPTKNQFAEQGKAKAGVQRVKPSKRVTHVEELCVEKTKK